MNNNTFKKRQETRRNLYYKYHRIATRLHKIPNKTPMVLNLINHYEDEMAILNIVAYFDQSEQKEAA